MAGTDVCECEPYFLRDHKWLKRALAGGGGQHVTRPETAVERKTPLPSMEEEWMNASEIGWRASESHCGFEVGPKEILHSRRLYHDR